MAQARVRVDNLDPAQAQHYSRMELRRMVRRLLSAGMNSEQVKEWLVAAIPDAFVYASQQGLRTRRSKGHTVAVPTHRHRKQKG